MKERPIICRDDEVRAFLDGRKTQLRRPMKPIVSDAFSTTPLFKIDGGLHVPLDDKVRRSVQVLKHCPFGVVGDRLWVRECWAAMAKSRKTRVAYRSTMTIQNQTPQRGPALDLVPWAVDETGRVGHTVREWRSSSQMPRWASRITLEITGVRVERLQDITEKDATLEGFEMDFPAYTARGFFCDAWDIAYGGRDRTTMKPIWSAWVNNPFVWVIGVEVRNDGG
jgi:hypothetical protein